ncbi:hypothetical protein MSPP1_002717 [Malassezia sp. CBS 17886]|nr:hypothetical protein MSPP1_002717 [Malassezia sp. CBS 17886]
MAKSMRLSFKGDKAATGRTQNTWVAAEEPDEVAGPTFLFQEGPEGAAQCVALHAHLSQAEVAVVERPTLPAQLPDDGPLVAEAEVTPHTVYQVWVATKIPMSDAWTLKSAQDTFLGCDKFGSVSASSEARGPQEEWVIRFVYPPGSSAHDTGRPAWAVEGARRGVALQSSYGGWLMLGGDEGGRRHLRADATELDAAAIWDIRVQWKFRHEDGAQAAGRILDEASLSRSRQAWNAGSKAQFATSDRRELRKAQQEGRLSEAMLDRRARLKSDKYAK